MTTLSTQMHRHGDRVVGAPAAPATAAIPGMSTTATMSTMRKRTYSGVATVSSSWTTFPTVTACTSPDHPARPLGAPT